MDFRTRWSLLFSVILYSELAYMTRCMRTRELAQLSGFLQGRQDVRSLQRPKCQQCQGAGRSAGRGREECSLGDHGTRMDMAFSSMGA